MNDTETIVVQNLIQSGQTLATAESCTGGLLAHRVTNVPGASACFLGGVVVYGNEAKTALAGVAEDDLATLGAVSETVARQLAEGARQRFGADWGIGITGIAGPGGGTALKPVGLVYIAVAGPGDVKVERHVFEGDRLCIKTQTADRALTALEEALT